MAKVSGDMEKAQATIRQLSHDVQIEHEEGFTKALRQVAYLMGTDPLTVSFDIAQDIFDGEMSPFQCLTVSLRRKKKKKKREEKKKKLSVEKMGRMPRRALIMMEMPV